MTLGGGRRQAPHLLHAERLARRPGRELVDLSGKDELVLADEVDQRPARIGARTHAARLEALHDPAHDIPLRHLPGEDVADLRAGLRKRRVLPYLLADELRTVPGAGARR